MADILGKINDKMSQMSTLFARFDKDEDLYFMKPYQMTYGGEAVKEVVNVTLNDALIFVRKAISVLGGAAMQTIVESEALNDKQTSRIEEFMENFFYEVDRRLAKREILSLDSFINEQVCLRGRIVGRVCVRMEKENFIPDVLPIDARYFVYDIGDDLNWGCAIFTRSKEQIEAEYGKKVNDFTEVKDYWDKEQNVIFVNNEIVREQKNIYGYPPYVVAICPVGSSLYDTQAREHVGESILWANRELFQEKNRIATILETLTHMALFTGMQYESSKGELAPKPQQSPFGMRKVLPVEKGGGYRPMPVADIKNATRLQYSMVESALQRGSISAIDYGNLTFPLSSLAITRLTGSRDDILLPLVQAKSTFYQAISKMIIAQCMQLDKPIKLNNATYTSSDLEGDYHIGYQFRTESQEQNIANLSIANAAQGLLSGDTIRRDILKLENPDEENAKFQSEQAEKIDEVLYLFRRGLALENEADRITGIDKEIKQMEAKIVMDRIKVLLNQRKAQGLPEQKPASPAVPAAKELLPLTSQGRINPQVSASQVSAPQNEVTPTGEENG